MRRVGIGAVAGKAVMGVLAILGGYATAQTSYAGKWDDSGAAIIGRILTGGAPLSYAARYDSCVATSLTPTIASGITSSWASGTPYGTLTVNYPVSSFPNGGLAEGQVVYITTSSYSSPAAGELIQSSTTSGGTASITLSSANFATNPGTVTGLGYCRNGATRGEGGSQLTFFGTPNANGIGSPDSGYVMGNLFSASNAASINTGFTDADFGSYSVWTTDHITTIPATGSTYPPAPIDADGGGFMYGSANDVPLVFENDNSTRFITHVIESRVLAGKTTPCNTTTNPCIVGSAVTESNGCNPAGGSSGCATNTLGQVIQFSGAIVPSRDPNDPAGTFFELYWGSQYPWALQLWKCQLISSYSGGYPTGTGDYISCGSQAWADFQNGGLPGIGWDYNKNWSGTAFTSASDDFTNALGGGASYQGLGDGTGGAKALSINSFVMPVHNNVDGTNCPNGASPNQAFSNNCSYVYEFIPNGCSVGSAYSCSGIGSTTAATASGSPPTYSCPSGFTAENDLGSIRPTYLPMCEPNWNSCPTQYYFQNASITGISGSGAVGTVTSTLNPKTGTMIVIKGVTPATYNGEWTVTASTSTQFTFASTLTGTYVSGGTAAGGCGIEEANGSGYWINIGKVNSQGPGYDVVNYDTVNGYSHWNTRTALMDRGYRANGSGSNPMPSGQLYSDDAMFCNQAEGATACTPGSGNPPVAVPYTVLFTIHDTNQTLAHGYSDTSATGGNSVSCNYMSAEVIDPSDCSPQIVGQNWPEISSGPNGECTGTINATQTYWPAVVLGTSTWLGWPAAMQWQSATAAGGTSPYTGGNQWAVDPVNHQYYVTTTSGPIVSGNTAPSLDPTEWNPAPYYCNKHFADWDSTVPITAGGALRPGMRPVLLIGSPFGAGGGHSVEGQLYSNSGGDFYAHLFGTPNCDLNCLSLNGNPGPIGQPNPGSQLLYNPLPSDDHTVYDNANTTDTTPPYIGTSQVPFWAFDPACGTGAPHAACPSGLSTAVCSSAGYGGFSLTDDPICNSYVAAGYGEELALNSNPRNGLMYRFAHHGGSGSIGTYTGQNQWPTISPDGQLAAVTTDAMNTRGDVTAPTGPCQNPTRAMFANWAKDACVQTGDVFLSKATGGPTFTLTSCGSSEADGTTTCTAGVTPPICNTGATEPTWAHCTSLPCTVTDSQGNTWTYDGENSCETDIFVTALPTAEPAP